MGICILFFFCVDVIFYGVQISCDKQKRRNNYCHSVRRKSLYGTRVVILFATADDRSVCGHVHAAL
jgi:hypothetical protein